MWQRELDRAFFIRSRVQKLEKIRVSKMNKETDQLFFRYSRGMDILTSIILSRVCLLSIEVSRCDIVPKYM